MFQVTETRTANISYPANAAFGGVRSAALRSISLSCRTGNRPQSASACSFLRCMRILTERRCHDNDYVLLGGI